MFTVKVSANGMRDVATNFDTCAEAWIWFGNQIADIGDIMKVSTAHTYSNPWEGVHVRMAYEINTSNEVEYAHVVIA